MDSDIRSNPWKRESHFGYSGMDNISNLRKHGGMRYYVLWLLSRQPMRGSDIISTILKQTMGWWKPSPGTIYPLLSTLQSEGLIERLQDHSYQLTDAGYEFIGITRSADKKGEEFWNADRALGEIETFVSFLEDAELDQVSRDRIGQIVDRMEKLRGK